MSDNRFPDNDKLQKAYLDSLRRQERLNAGLEGEENSPVDAHTYEDPEEKDPEIYNKIVSEIERKRAVRSSSIWSDEPVIPVKDSVWLDQGKQEKPAPVKEPEGRKPSNRTTFELKLTEDMKEKLRGSEKPEPPKQTPPKETSPSRQRPAGQSSRTRQRPAEQSSSRQRPAESTSRTRQRPEASSRTRERTPSPEASPARVRPAAAAKAKYKDHETEFSFINAVLCILMVFGVGLALVVMKRESGVLESENRMYAKFPEFTAKSYFTGEFTDGIVNFYTDTIPNREKFKSFSSTFSKLFGINTDDYSVIGDVHEGEKQQLDEEKIRTTTKATIYTGEYTTTTTSNGGKTLDDSQNEQSQSETETVRPVETVKKDVVPEEGEWAGNIVMANMGTPEVRAMPIFYGLFENGEEYAGVLNDYKKMVGQTVNVYNMQVPLASAYYLPRKMREQGVGSDQHDCILNVNASLNGVIGVDLYDVLGAHDDEYIYSRTDHHWQPLGAYYAAQEFAKEAGVPFADLSTYQRCEIEGFCGTLYAYSENNLELKQYPDTFIYYKPQNSYTIDYYDESFSSVDENKGHSLFFDWVSGVNCYSAILGGDLDIPEIKTDVHNGRTLVVIKDSYGNALIPFLTGSFEKIYVVDFRYATISMQDFFNRVHATDILFGLSISGSYTNSHIKAIRNIMQ